MADAENVDRFNNIASEAFAMLDSRFPVGWDFGLHVFDIPKDQFGGVTSSLCRTHW